MASSSGSLETSSNSRPQTFSLSAAFSTSFSDVLAGAESRERAGCNGDGAPKFKSIPPPSLPISPCSYFAIPPGLSPTVLLDSPVLLSSNMLQSPTTGTMPINNFNWMDNYHQDIKVENSDKNSEFSFHTNSMPGNSQTSSFRPSSMSTSLDETLGGHQQWKHHQNPINHASGLPSLRPEIKSESIATMQTNSSEMPSNFNNSIQSSQTFSQQRRADDGYNWRKYGQKQVKGSENPRSYYKCTYPNCPTKKKVERSLDGQITEIVYKGTHNHPKPQATRRNSASLLFQGGLPSEPSDPSSGRPSGTQMDSVATPENSLVSYGDDDLDLSSHRSNGDDLDEDEPGAKRWKSEGDNEVISASGNRTVREPRVVVQTTSDIDILDDGYRWRKYGQKVVKGNPNPRSYYKCTTTGCPVRKHVERASNDLRAVITTYEGKHNHDIPAAKGSGGYNTNRLMLDNNNNNNNNNGSFAMAIRPSAMANQTNNMTTNSLLGRRSNSAENQTFYASEMLEAHASYGFSGYDNSIPSYANFQQQQQQQQPGQVGGIFPRTKGEPSDDFFLDSFLG